MKVLLEDIREVGRSSKHDTVIAKIVNIFPVESCFDKNLHDVKMSLEGSPVKRVGSDLFCTAHHHCTVLWLHLQILQSRLLGN